MKLLFDQNLSPHLVNKLDDLYPDSNHVCDVGLERAFDNDIWEYARENHFIIVSKDADFSEMSMLKNSRPKVIWVRRGNCSTQEIEDMLRRDFSLVKDMEQNEDLGILQLL